MHTQKPTSRHWLQLCFTLPEWDKHRNYRITATLCSWSVVKKGKTKKTRDTICPHTTLIKYTHSLIFTLPHCLRLVLSLSSAHLWPFCSLCTSNDERRERSGEGWRGGPIERGGMVGGGRWERARGREGGRKGGRDWFIGAEERDQGRIRGRGRMVEWSRKCVWERERKREEGQGCNWWETWPTPPSSQWSGSVLLPTPASPSSIHSCLHPSLQFSHSVLLRCFCCFSYAFHPSILLFTRSPSCWYHFTHPYLQLFTPSNSITWNHNQQFEVNYS